MKIHEVSDTSLRWGPENDDFSKFTGKDHNPRKPILTLRHINKLKKMKKAQQEEHEKRTVLLNLMYAAPVGGEEGP